MKTLLILLAALSVAACGRRHDEPPQPVAVRAPPSVPAAVTAPPSMPPALPSAPVDVYGYVFTGSVGAAPFRADLDAGLLTTVALFGAEVRAGGTLHGFDPTSVVVRDLVARAHQQGVAVHLAVYLFAKPLTTDVLQHAQDALLQRVLATVVDGDLDGVSLDFEGVDTSVRAPYAAFVEKLAAALHAQHRKLTVAVAQRPPPGEDVPRLAAAADALVVMGYDYSWGGSTQASPNAPLHGAPLWSRSYETDVFDRRAGKASWLARLADPRKLVLALPLYGRRFPLLSGQNGRVPAKRDPAAPIKVPRASALAGRAERAWDAASRTPYWEYAEGGRWYQSWNEDAESIRAKLAEARAAGLGGVGLWQVGWESDAIRAALKEVRP